MRQRSRCENAFSLPIPTRALVLLQRLASVFASDRMSKTYGIALVSLALRGEGMTNELHVSLSALLGISVRCKPDARFACSRQRGFERDSAHSKI